MNKRLIALLTVLLIFLLVVISLLIYNQWPLLTGNRIVLATHPVDPFDPFMGQYMTINYEISSLDGGNFAEGDSVYVLLKEDNQGIWRKESLSSSKPGTGDFIKGKVNPHSRISFGIEQYYFERNANLPTTNITVEVAVASSGRAKIVQLLTNGKPVEIEYKKFDIKG